MTRTDFIKMSAAVLGTAGLGFGVVTFAAANTNHTVSEKGKVFAPARLVVAKGDTVSFVNDDKSKHNVMIRSLKYNSGLQAPGESSDVTFDKAGNFKVRCAIHPKMKMTVTVK